MRRRSRVRHRNFGQFHFRQRLEFEIFAIVSGAGAPGAREGAERAASSSSVSPAARWKRRRNSPKRSAPRGSPRSLMKLFELRRKFGGAAIVAGAENEVEKFFERGSVTRRTAQNRFEQTDGFLRQAIAGE